MEKLPDTHIAFGSGGGFTNLVTEYVLLENGKIVKKAKEKGGYDAVTRIDRDKAAQCYAGAKILKLDTLSFNEPGNMYYFISFKKDDKTENKIIWGSVDKPVSADIKGFHKLLMSLLPKPNTKSEDKK